MIGSGPHNGSHKSGYPILRESTKRRTEEEEEEVVDDEERPKIPKSPRSFGVERIADGQEDAVPTSSEDKESDITELDKKENNVIYIVDQTDPRQTSAPCLQLFLLNPHIAFDGLTVRTAAALFFTLLIAQPES